MSTSPHSSAGPEKQIVSPDKPDIDFQYDSVDLREVFLKACRGIPQTLGFTAIGLAIAATAYLVANPLTAVSTSMRVTFAFRGFSNGEYPDHAKFQPEDIFAPEIIADAMKRQGLETENIKGGVSTVRSGLSIEGLISPNVTRERDHLRATGQTPPPFFADEYLITLSLPRNFPLNNRQREQLLDGIVDIYREMFQRTYAEIPVTFGNAFDTLHNADFSEYELVLSEEVKKITAFLNQQLNVEDDGSPAGYSNPSRTFRSRTTNLSFSDLLEKAQLFQQIHLNETLSIIYENGLSRNRSLAIMKMDYYLRELSDQEKEAAEKEALVDGLLARSQERSQSYMMGIRSQLAQPNSGPFIVDQGLVDTLLANDAYNFLVHQALNAGLALKTIQAEQFQLLERRKNLENFSKSDDSNRSANLEQAQKSLSELATNYNDLISNIRKTYADFIAQQFADAVRISAQPETASLYKPVVTSGIVGGVIGLVFGFGLSQLGIFIGAKKK